MTWDDSGRFVVLIKTNRTGWRSFGVLGSQRANVPFAPVVTMTPFDVISLIQRELRRPGFEAAQIRKVAEDKPKLVPPKAAF